MQNTHIWSPAKCVNLHDNKRFELPSSPWTYSAGFVDSILHYYPAWQRLFGLLVIPMNLVNQVGNSSFLKYSVCFILSVMLGESKHRGDFWRGTQHWSHPRVCAEWPKKLDELAPQQPWLQWFSIWLCQGVSTTMSRPNLQFPWWNQLYMSNLHN
jgi:hypothetical protein